MILMLKIMIVLRIQLLWATKNLCPYSVTIYTRVYKPQFSNYLHPGIYNL